jgi:hypothetical protein
MRVEDLVGSRVLIKQADEPEHEGYISSVTNAVASEDIKTAVNESTFRIELASGDVIETSGIWFSRIDNDDYEREGLQ